MRADDKAGRPLLDELMEDKEFARLERQEEFILHVTEAILEAKLRLGAEFLYSAGEPGMNVARLIPYSGP